MDDLNSDLYRKIKFKKVGYRDKYEVDLFSIGEKPFDICKNPRNKQSFTEELLTHYHTQVVEYLKGKGFHEFRGKFQLQDGQIIKCVEGMELYSKWLFEVIEERDENSGGQTADYLAALIEHWCWRLQYEWHSEWWNGSPNITGYILDTAMWIQHCFFQLKLLDIQEYYSTGLHAYKNCKEKSKKPRKKGHIAFLKKVKKIMIPWKKKHTFKEFFDSAVNGSVEDLTIIEQLNEKYEIRLSCMRLSKIVTYNTIQDWYSGCNKK